MSGREEHEDLHAELLYLRKESGFTALRVLNAGFVRDQLGGRDQPFDILRSRFVSAIESLSDPERDLLLVAYGLDVATVGMQTLKERRALSKQRLDRELDTVASREDAAIQHLRAQLVTGWYPQSPFPLRVPELHNGLVVEAMTFGVRVENRLWSGTLEDWQFTAVFDGTAFLNISTTYSGTVVVDSDDYRVDTERIGNSYSHRFYARTPFKRGKSYGLRFAVGPENDTHSQEPIQLTSRGFHERTLRAQATVQFIGERPELIWQFSGLTYPEQPGRPLREDLLDCDNNGQVQVKWFDLHGGLFSGIAWKWASE